MKPYTCLGINVYKDGETNRHTKLKVQNARDALTVLGNMLNLKKTLSLQPKLKYLTLISSQYCCMNNTNNTALPINYTQSLIGVCTE